MLRIQWTFPLRTFLLKLSKSNHLEFEFKLLISRKTIKMYAEKDSIDKWQPEPRIDCLNDETFSNFATGSEFAGSFEAKR